MTKFWSAKIQKEVKVEENSLSSRDKYSEEYSRIFHGQKDEQMHPFVFSLLQQMMDPTMISFQSS